MINLANDQFRVPRRDHPLPPTRRSPMLVAIIALLPVALTDCGSLPQSGPSTATVRDQYLGKGADVGIIEIDRAAIDALAVRPVDMLTQHFEDRRPPAELRIGVGDALDVTIYEAAAGGLFAVAESTNARSGTVRGTQLPPQVVDQTGMITVPYCGQVMAAGKTPSEIASTIINGLRGKAIEPQVIVSIAQNQSNLVTIAGEVGQGMRFPLRLNGDRILDAIALAGGPRSPSYETFVRLTRGERSGSMLLQSIVANSHENIYLRPGDDIFVYRQPPTFTVFGATGRNGQIPFDSDKLTMAEALAKSGGLLDHRADAKGVYIFRYEDAEIYRRIKNPGAATEKNPPATKSGRVPTVFHANLETADAYMLSADFPMRDKDLIFVSNAPISDLQKVLGIVGSAFGATGPAIAKAP
jgi:polysaccharide export outer membrane protein